ncbi:structural maintenance of chromosomes protein 1 [Tanacetum coccineum]
MLTNFDYLEYEEKRDMGAHIAKLESSLNELKMAMCKVDMIEKELKSTIGKATQEIDTIRKEVQALAKVYDFGELRRSQKKNMRPAEREKLKAEFKQKIEILISKFDRTVPNLKAIDQYVALKEKKRAASKEYHNARNELNKISEQFKTMRTKRFNGLMDPASVGLGYRSDTGAKKCLVGESDKTVMLQALEIEIRISSVSNVEFTEHEVVKKFEVLENDNLLRNYEYGRGRGLAIGCYS